MIRNLLPAVLLLTAVTGAHAMTNSLRKPPAARIRRTAPPDAILKTLRREHPRLILTPARLADLRAALQRGDPAFTNAFAGIRASADALLAKPPVAYEIPDGKRLLSVSRDCKKRVHALALTAVLTGETRYRERLWREMEAVAAFKDWNPAHFLDTAEMAAAVALAYDWLYDQWTPAQRQALQMTLIEKALGVGLQHYTAQPTPGDGWWINATHNWNQVCNGGLLVAALALAEDVPAIPSRVIVEALARLPAAMHAFAPDGGFIEGPGYWRYAVEYTVLALAALESSGIVGPDLAGAPGFAQTGAFRMHTIGTAGLCHNFADCGAKPGQSPELYWLAHRFNQPAWAAFERRMDPTITALDLIWDAAAPSSTTGQFEHVPLDAYFRDCEVVTMRASWTNPAAAFLSFKGGRNGANHGHLDLGSFVFDALGERWFHDLPHDDYNLPGFFSKPQRWDYFSNRAEAHNTLILSPGALPAGQVTDAVCAITDQRLGGASPTAELDLTPAYAGVARQVTRRFTFNERKTVTIRDRVAVGGALPDDPQFLWWLAYTDAAATPAADGRSVRLAKNGRHLTVSLQSPGGVFEVQPAAPLAGSPRPAGQRDDTQTFRRLTLRLPARADQVVEVMLTPEP